MVQYGEWLESTQVKQKPSVNISVDASGMNRCSLTNYLPRQDEEPPVLDDKQNNQLYISLLFFFLAIIRPPEIIIFPPSVDHRVYN